jgi:hypothetical protein
MACPTGATCENGTCSGVACPGSGQQCLPGQMCCSAGCTDTTSDANNCGGCGVVCTGGGTCVASVCQGGTGGGGGTTCGGQSCDTSNGFNMCCSDVCVVTFIDPNNCGGCGVMCDPATQQCFFGFCINNQM